MLSIALVLLVFLGSLLIQIGALWLGSRWAKIAGVTLWRLLSIFGLVVLASLLLRPAVSVLEDTGVLPNRILSLGELVLGVVVNLVVISRVLRTSMARASIPLLVLFASVVFNLGVVFLAIRPFVFEGFIIPSNSDAPTVVGPHRVAVCPRCGGRLIVPYEQGQPFQTEERAPLGICASCLQASRATPTNLEVHPADRIFTNKLLAPRRWDLITFRSPTNRDEQYVKRLIGLPGEEVVIKEGQVWVNGKPLEPPPEIASLRFTPIAGSEADALWGSPGRPAKLGPGENFVVGDFAEWSTDSRTWRNPIPQSDITGVVTLVYYPFSRWRIFR